MKSINGLASPLETRARGTSQSFERVAHLMQEFRQGGVTLVTRDPEGGFLFVIRAELSGYEERIRELLDLLAITKRPSGGFLVLPIRLAVGGRPTDAIHVETRSVLEILRIAGACIQIPESHLKARVVEPVVGMEAAADFIQIRTSRTAPGGAGAVAINYRDWWYYVDDSDTDSKQAFAFLRAMVGLRLLEKGEEPRAPVLTIPVG